MATIQGGPRTTRFGDYNQRACSSHRGSPQLAGKFSAVSSSLYLGTPTGRVSLAGMRPRVEKPDYEAHLPAQEAQAGPCPRVSWPYAHARGTPPAQAPPRQGTQAPLHLRSLGPAG
jgi:hypothetical protein